MPIYLKHCVQMTITEFAINVIGTGDSAYNRLRYYSKRITPDTFRTTAKFITTGDRSLLSNEMIEVQNE